MNKRQLILEMDKLASDLGVLLDKLAERPEPGTSGSLVCRKSNGKTRYFLHSTVEGENGSRDQYLGRNEQKLIRSLAREKYLARLETTAKKEKRYIERMAAKLDLLPDTDSVYPSLPQWVRELTTPDDMSDEAYVARFLRERPNEPHKKIDPLAPFKTRKGELVRSKSELIIANMLSDANVPYRYEKILYLEADQDAGILEYIFPDFLVLNRRTRQEYCWEHLGMMDDPVYCEKSQLKLERYAEKGFFPGINMIITFESKARALDTEYIGRIIEKYLK